MRAFLARFTALIHFVLTGFDRLRFGAESQLLNNNRGVDSFLFRHKIRYVDFIDYCEQLTKQLCKKTEDLAKTQGVPLVYLNSPHTDKQEAALEAFQKQPSQAPQGRIALLSVVESCMTYRMRKNPDGRAYPKRQQGKCLFYYHYFQHPELGLCYVRVQTHFPFILHIGFNGRHWLFQQLRRRGVHFEHRDNLLLKVDDIKLAQRLLDQQRTTNFTRLLKELVQPIHPHWDFLQEHAPYHWMAEQTEWASDFVFHSPADLSRWYECFVRHGIERLNCTDAMRYLGKKRPYLCRDEVKIDLRERPEGIRLKFWQGRNSIKIYDKHQTSFRVETTISHPKAFRVFRKKLWGNDEEEQPKWREMSKSVMDMKRRAEVSASANGRLLESLATVAEPTTLGELLKPLGQPVYRNGKRVARALNPLTGNDGKLLRLIAQGRFQITGFRNADLRQEYYGTTTDEKVRKKQSAAITRLLAILRAHGLIVKVQKSHRYQLSAHGRRITTALLAAHQCNPQQLAAA